MRLRYAVLLLPLMVSPLLVTSPVACGCEPDPTSMAGQMAIYVATGASTVSAESSRALGASAFVGKDTHRLAKNPSPDSECLWASPTRLECIYWHEVGLLYSRGRLVHIAADASGRVTVVSVLSIRKLIGISFGANA